MRRKPQAYNAPAVFAEGVVFNKADMPLGYVALGDLYEEDHRLHAFVLRACHENKLRRFRFKRTPKDVQAPIYVNAEDLKQATDAYTQGLNKDHAEQLDKLPDEPNVVPESLDHWTRVLAQASAVLSRKERHDTQLELAVVAICQMNNSISELLDVMTRVAKACEGMASAWCEKQQASDEEKASADAVNSGFSVFDN